MTEEERHEQEQEGRVVRRRRPRPQSPTEEVVPTEAEVAIEAKAAEELIEADVAYSEKVVAETKPQRRPRRPLPKLKATVVEEVIAEVDVLPPAKIPSKAKAIPVGEVAGNSFLTTMDELFEALTNGQAITITRVDGNNLIVTLNDATAIDATTAESVPVVIAPAVARTWGDLSGDEYKAYRKRFRIPGSFKTDKLSEDYVEFMAIWHEMSMDEKEEYATSEAIQAKWNKNLNTKTNTMFMTSAVLKVLEIDKFLPEWVDTSERMQAEKDLINSKIDAILADEFASA